ncbi:MAG: DUF5916 domain-containing protein [Chitinophagaceae bacterium]
MRFYKSNFLVTALLSSYFLTAQEKRAINYQQQFQLHINKTIGAIKIDGELDEATWQQAEKTSPFWRKFPSDHVLPKKQTEVKVSYDDTFIYFAFTAYDSGVRVIQSLKRDGGHDENDAVGIMLDPINQRTSGFYFVVNPFNAQSDDQLNGGSGELTLSWDNKWYSATRRYADRWTAEIAIPFKTLRYTQDRLTWGINFLRSDLTSNEYSTWTEMPLNFRAFDLGYTGALIWDKTPPATTGNIAFIPYITGETHGNKEDSAGTSASGNAGFDAKVALSSSLNLDLTVNPDFSQVEVDRQVTNLTRYSIFFPERRTFFLENADLFADFGIGPIRPFYSRRIGLDNNARRIPILFGARLSGNITKRTRIGVMNMQTGRKGDFAPQNYAAVSVSQSVFKRSLVRGYFLNQQGFLSATEKAQDPLKQYSRNAGADFNYSNLAGTWGGWAAYHDSFKPGITTQHHYSDFGGTYSSRSFTIVFDANQVGTNYYTDMGFVERILNYDAARDTSIRVGFKSFYNELAYRVLPKKGFVIRHEIEYNHFYVLNADNSFNEFNQQLSYNMAFKNSSGLNFSSERNAVTLLFPVSFTEGKPLPAAKYQYAQAGLFYGSDIRRMFVYTIGARTGSFYNGSFRQLTGSVSLRKQPHLNITVQAEYNKLVFPGQYGKAALFLIAPRIELNFSTNLFWTTFVQYNTQANNFNINSRFQWRYKPMSDIFLVYTDNYFTTPFFTNKNRALVFKMNYWLNL